MDHRRFSAVTGPNLNPVCPPPVDGQIVRVDDRIFQPADTRHDGNRAVPQCAKLRQAARLEPRRHDQRIRAGLNQMGQTFVMPDRDAHPFRIGLCGRTITILQVAISAAPQHDQLHSFAYDRREIFEKKIEPLLLDRRPMTPSMKRIRRDLQAKPPLQGRLVGRPVLQNLRLRNRSTRPHRNSRGCEGLSKDPTPKYQCR